MKNTSSTPPANPSNTARARSHSRGFSLVELLVTISVMALLTGIAAPSIRHLTDGGMSSVEAKSEGFLAQAHQYAVTQRTFVRVGFAKYTDSASGRDSLVCVALASTTGDLRSDKFDDEKMWRQVTLPVLIRGIKLDDTQIPESSSMVSVTKSSYQPFTRKVGSSSSMEFSNVLQIDPQGQVTLTSTSYPREVGIAMVNPRNLNDPVVFQISGLTGKLRVMRKEQLVALAQ